MLFETNKQKGKAGLSMAIGYFGSNGYNVSIPLNDTQDYDLVIEKSGIFQSVQCKATGSKDGIIDFRNTGGTEGGVYGNALNTSIDLFFCLKDDKTMYLIPRKDIPNQKQIQLRNKKSIQGFDTSKYIVNF
jgi:penicillin-binding protein-related factor A (putative recombinase)